MNSISIYAVSPGLVLSPFKIFRNIIIIYRNNSAVKFGSNSIATTVTTTGNGGLTLGVPANKSATYSSLLSYNVAVATTGAYGVNTPAGTYTDTYHISVFF